MQEVHGWRAAGFQNVTLAFASRIFVFEASAQVSRMDDGWCSICGARLGATHIRLNTDGVNA
eukprot:3097227-Pyramimonas_sp.AAC.2